MSIGDELRIAKIDIGILEDHVQRRQDKIERMKAIITRLEQSRLDLRKAMARAIKASAGAQKDQAEAVAAERERCAHLAETLTRTARRWITDYGSAHRNSRLQHGSRRIAEPA